MAEKNAMMMGSRLRISQGCSTRAVGSVLTVFSIQYSSSTTSTVLSTYYRLSSSFILVPGSSLPTDNN